MEITDEKLQELKEQYYLWGQRTALFNQLRNILHQLSVPYHDADADAHQENLMTIARLTAEREETISALRALCDEHGDNEWDNDLHLADVVNKHLGDHL